MYKINALTQVKSSYNTSKSNQTQTRTHPGIFFVMMTFSLNFCPFRLHDALSRLKFTSLASTNTIHENTPCTPHWKLSRSSLTKMLRSLPSNMIQYNLRDHNVSHHKALLSAAWTLNASSTNTLSKLHVINGCCHLCHWMEWLEVPLLAPAKQSFCHPSVSNGSCPYRDTAQKQKEQPHVCLDTLEGLQQGGF